MLKLNLGSGQFKIKGYENIDKMYGTDAYPLQYDLGEVDEIRASHILEHFGKHEVLNVLKNWVDKLRPGGVLKIAVPDFDKIAVDYIKLVKHDC
jgi:predicted SAM-dependent methyltransferase